MVWSVSDIQWYEYYNLSVEYYTKNGNLLVPLRYKTANNIQLGSWISYQRQSYKSGKLSTTKIECFEPKEKYPYTENERELILNVLENKAVDNLIGILFCSLLL